MESMEGGFRHFLSTFQYYSKNCSIKAYSVQDQQAAGCKGNDTVEQCMEKLYDFCMSKLDQPEFSKDRCGKGTCCISRARQTSGGIRKPCRTHAQYLWQMRHMPELLSFRPASSWYVGMKWRKLIGTGFDRKRRPR